jgi:hypothetical protein
MGMSKETYVGIYLEVPYMKKEVKTVTYKHPETGKTMKSKFCPNTGVEGIKTVNTNTEYQWPCPYIQEDGFVEDIFFSPAYTGAGKNIQTFLLSEGINVLDETENYSLTNKNISEIIENFKVKYAKYLDYYTKEFGEYTIHYGVVNYVH